MKERPILFSGPMVRALFDGRKTQTRRAVKFTDSGRVKAVGSNQNWHLENPDAVKACPYGAVGDRLWVREAWATSPGWNAIKPIDLPSPGCSGVVPSIFYRADYGDGRAGTLVRPSIFMRRWMSRITLEITAVRIERLNEINGHEAWAEGCPFHAATDPSRAAIINWFRDVWESSYGAGSWAANPWVWVIEFRRVSL